ncbi:MAG: tRNA pseudouridine(13) synthase TruD [Candidatus Micrarchaeaceae archaeon]
MSKTAGNGGRIKKGADTFVVKEITQNGILLEPGRHYSSDELGEQDIKEGGFARFILQKKNWDTIQALTTIARRFGRGVKSIGYAGMKDRLSTSVQLASIFGISSGALAGLRIKDIEINGAWQSSSGVGLGDLLGNSFSIAIDRPLDEKRVMRILSELNGQMPNYFGMQRFGSRGNNFRIGISILNGNFKEAVMAFLTSTDNEINSEAVDARRRLAEEQDFAAAAGYFPEYLKYERKMLSYISKYGNFANALRLLPRGLLIMFIHSVEDIIFNAALEARIRSNDFENELESCGLNAYGFPDITIPCDRSSGTCVPVGNLIGYETPKEKLSSYEKAAIDALGINAEMFKIESMPELSMKGSLRPILVKFKDFSYENRGEESILSFSLPAGSYATVFANEFTKQDMSSVAEMAPELGDSWR